MLEEHLHFPDWFLVAAAVPHCYVDIWESRNLDNASGEAMSIAGWRLWDLSEAVSTFLIEIESKISK